MPKTQAKINRPAKKFMAAPAAKMISRFHHAALGKERGSWLSWSSPSMAQ